MVNAAWIGEWTRLAQRIEALSRAAESMQSSFKVNSTDLSSTVRKVIAPSGNDLLGDISAFLNRFKPSLPSRAAAALTRLGQSAHFNLDDGAALGNLQTIAGILATASEVNFHLGDPQIGGARLVERAFLHL